jgi:hypothetical protein
MSDNDRLLTGWRVSYLQPVASGEQPSETKKWSSKIHSYWTTLTVVAPSGLVYFLYQLIM